MVVPPSLLATAWTPNSLRLHVGLHEVLLWVEP